MKPTFSDLTPEQQATFGNGCTWVPDFIFTASCRHHDFNYSRGGYLKDKLKADFDFAYRMYMDSSRSWHYVISVVYFAGVTLNPISYAMFTWGRYRSLTEIIERDKQKKDVRV